MKKVFFFVFMMACFASYAQTAKLTSVTFNKRQVPGVIIALTGYDAEFVSTTLQHRFENIGGLKGSNAKEFRVYLSQVFPEFGTIRHDIYTLVSKTTKKDPFVSITLMVSTGNENFISPQDDPELTQKMQDFLVNFIPYLQQFDKANQIQNLNNEIKKLEKPYNSLDKDIKKMQKDRDNIDKKLKDKENEFSTKSSEIQKLKDQLNAIQNK